MSYVFNRDANGTIYISSLITGIAVGLANTTDYTLMVNNLQANPNTPPTFTPTQRATIKNYLSQINPLPTITTLNGAVLNLAQDNANQTATLEAYISSH